MAKEKKKKEKTSVVLPKAWQSVKHRNETAQARANYEDIWTFVGLILLILFLAFVFLGGVSQTGVLRFVFNWSHNVGEKVSGWIEGGSVIVNEDGVYYDPTGQTGYQIKDESIDVEMPFEDTLKENTEGHDDEPIRSEVQEE